MNGSNYSISDEDSRVIGTLKAIMAVMVVFIHAHYDGINLATGDVIFEQPRWFDITKRLLSGAIPCCAVPGFFILAAILLYKKPFNWKDNIIKKAKTLLIPYFIINTFWIVFYACAQLNPVLRPYFSNPDKIVANWGVLEYLDAYLGFGTSKAVHLIYGPLWFVRDLFTLNIIAPLIKKIIDKCPRLYASAILLMMLLGVNTHIFCLKSTALFYFSVGYYIVKYNIHFSDVKKINFPILSVMYAIMLAMYIYFLDSKWWYLPVFFDINLGLLWWTRASFFIMGMKGKVQELLRVLEKYNFCIYIFHQIPTTILEKILFTVLPKSLPFIVAEYFAVIIVILTGCIVFSMFLERFTPRFFALLTGGRIESQRLLT